ncbi:MAG TPA: dihydropteroate synthase, partial [Mariprofundaceae bacterium]|nr:dihydropteroate synthase [Mariprofundaceae bacterium]
VWVMGVLNSTPDSFSDGGKYLNMDHALSHAHAMSRAGAAIIDIGGESTRPGAVPVPLEEELARVVPLIRSLAGNGVCVSVDTSKAEVMRQSLEAGASMVNDVTALQGDPASMGIVAGCGVDVCLMHMRGAPQTMQKHTGYEDVVSEVESFLATRIEACVKAGIRESAILIDPGIGFGKNPHDNLSLIAAIPRLKRMGFPVLMGVSRKSFLGALTGAPADDREMETAAAVSVCVHAGADVVRVHDVSMQARAARVAAAIRDA